MERVRLDHIDEVMRMLKNMRTESPAFKHIPDSAYDQVRATVLHLLQTSAFGYIEPGKGIMLATTMTPWYSNLPEMHELVLYVDPASRGSTCAYKLVRAVEREARSLGYEEFGVGISSRLHPERTKEMYEKMGYVVTGWSLTKRL